MDAKRMIFTTKSMDDLATLLSEAPPDFFALTTTSSLVRSRLARIAVRASFLPLAVENGLVVKGDVFVGCTGALFQLRAIDAILDDYTPTSHITVNHQNEVSRVGEVSGKASLASAGANGIKREEASSGASFSSQEGHLIATLQAPTFLSWSFFLHRGEKAVRDYLEGSLDLFALYSWRPEHRPRILVSARPSDRRFYSSSRRELGRLKSLALAAKLVARGVRLPEQRTLVVLVEGTIE